MKTMTRCTENHDEIGILLALTVMKTMTTLIYHTYQAKPSGPAEGGEHAR